MNDIISDKEIILRPELMKMFNVSKVTIWKWVKMGLIREHRIGHRCYCLKDELYEDLRQNFSNKGV